MMAYSSFSFFWDDDGRRRLKKKYQSIESHDEIIEEIDEDYVFPISAICKDKVNVDDEAKGYSADEENLNHPLKTQECLITSSKDDLKKKSNGDGGRKRLRMNLDGEYQKKINGRKRRLIKKFQSIESHDEIIEEIDEDSVFPISFTCEDNKLQASAKQINKET